MILIDLFKTLLNIGYNYVGKQYVILFKQNDLQKTKQKLKKRSVLNNLLKKTCLWYLNSNYCSNFWEILAWSFFGEQVKIYIMDRIRSQKFSFSVLFLYEWLFVINKSHPLSDVHTQNIKTLFFFLSWDIKNKVFQVQTKYEKCSCWHQHHKGFDIIL